MVLFLIFLTVIVYQIFTALPRGFCGLHAIRRGPLALLAPGARRDAAGGLEEAGKLVLRHVADERGHRLDGQSGIAEEKFGLLKPHRLDLVEDGTPGGAAEARLRGPALEREPVDDVLRPDPLVNMQPDVLQRGGDLRVALPANARGGAMDNAQVAERLALRLARRAVYGGRQHFNRGRPGAEIVGRDAGDGDGRAFAARHIVVDPENRQLVWHLYADPRGGGDHRAGDFVIRGKHGARLGQLTEPVAKCGFVRRRVVRLARRERDAVFTVCGKRMGECRAQLVRPVGASMPADECVLVPAETQQFLGGELRRGCAVVQHGEWLRFRSRVDVDHGNAEAATRQDVDARRDIQQAPERPPFVNDLSNRAAAFGELHSPYPEPMGGGGRAHAVHDLAKGGRVPVREGHDFPRRMSRDVTHCFYT